MPLWLYLVVFLLRCKRKVFIITCLTLRGAAWI